MQIKNALLIIIVKIKALRLKKYPRIIPITEVSLGGVFNRGNFIYAERLTCCSLYSSSASAKAVLGRYQTYVSTLEHEKLSISLLKVLRQNSKLILTLLKETKTQVYSPDK